MSQITIEEEEFRRLLNERKHLLEQVTELQARGTELVQQNRQLVALQVTKPISIEEVRHVVTDVFEQASAAFLRGLIKGGS